MKPLLTAAQSSPLPRHWWNANGRDITKTTLEPLLGNGAYRIKSIESIKALEAKPLPGGLILSLLAVWRRLPDRVQAVLRPPLRRVRKLLL